MEEHANTTQFCSWKGKRTQWHFWAQPRCGCPILKSSSQKAETTSNGAVQRVLQYGWRPTILKFRGKLQWSSLFLHRKWKENWESEQLDGDYVCTELCNMESQIYWTNNQYKTKQTKKKREAYKLTACVCSVRVHVCEGKLLTVDCWREQESGFLLMAWLSFGGFHTIAFECQQSALRGCRNCQELSDFLIACQFQVPSLLFLTAVTTHSTIKNKR